MHNFVDKKCAVVTCIAPAHGRGLCAGHYNQMRSSGLNPQQLLGMHGLTSTCAVPGCADVGTQVDHDHRCCHHGHGRTLPRCGFCNRGLVCAEHNRELHRVEAGGRRVSPAIRRYLQAFSPSFVPAWA